MERTRAAEEVYGTFAVLGARMDTSNDLVGV